MENENIYDNCRLAWITNEKAKKVAELLKGYCIKDDKEVYTNGDVLVPWFRVLDALSMVDQDEIEYSECQ